MATPAKAVSWDNWHMATFRTWWDRYRHFRAAQGLASDVLGLLGWRTVLTSALTAGCAWVWAHWSHLAGVEQFALALAVFACALVAITLGMPFWVRFRHRSATPKPETAHTSDSPIVRQSGRSSIDRTISFVADRNARFLPGYTQEGWIYSGLVITNTSLSVPILDLSASLVFRCKVGVCPDARVPAPAWLADGRRVISTVPCLQPDQTTELIIGVWQDSRIVKTLKQLLSDGNPDGDILLEGIWECDIVVSEQSGIVGTTCIQCVVGSSVGLHIDLFPTSSVHVVSDIAEGRATEQRQKIDNRSPYPQVQICKTKDSLSLFVHNFSSTVDRSEE